jgi:hypothetical protein
MSPELVVPVTIRHFHKPSGRLIATVVAAQVGNNRVAVGIARCHKNDRGSRHRGRQLASTRLTRGLGLADATASNGLNLADYDKSHNLFKIMTNEEFNKLVKENPFNKWGCPFGTMDEDVARLTKKPKKIAVKRKKS